MRVNFMKENSEAHVTLAMTQGLDSTALMEGVRNWFLTRPKHILLIPIASAFLFFAGDASSDVPVNDHEATCSGGANQSRFATTVLIGHYCAGSLISSLITTTHVVRLHQSEGVS
jgi:hypothetical protein